MSEGLPERPGRASLPHILVPWAPSEEAYRGRGRGDKKPIREIGNLQVHARKLTDELEAAQDTAQRRLAQVDPEIAPDGFALSVEAWSDDPIYKLAVQSLDTSGAKVLSVVPGTDQTPDRAVVWFPFTAVPKFFTKIEQFATETTRSGAPRNQTLVANIAELRLAVLRDLWQEEEPFPDPGEVRWWEVWLARLSRVIQDAEPGAVLHAVAAARGWRVAPGLLTFPDNVIALVQTTGTELAELLTTTAIPSELHRPRVASGILGVEPLDQDEFAADLANRIKGADPDAAAVCVLDTGVMAGHPLLSASIDRSLSALDGVGSADLHGHGTKMAGLALFADLDRDLMETGPVPLRHRLESVKVLRHDHDTQNDSATWPPGKRAPTRRSRREAPTTAGTSEAASATPARYTPTSGPAPARNWLTAAISA